MSPLRSKHVSVDIINKNLEMKKTKPTKYIYYMYVSTFNWYNIVGLVFSITKFVIKKFLRQMNWVRKKNLRVQTWLKFSNLFSSEAKKGQF